jgi:hypothetical protein
MSTMRRSIDIIGLHVGTDDGDSMVVKVLVISMIWTRTCCRVSEVMATRRCRYAMSGYCEAESEMRGEGIFEVRSSAPRKETTNEKMY